MDPFTVALTSPLVTWNQRKIKNPGNRMVRSIILQRYPEIRVNAPLLCHVHQAYFFIGTHDDQSLGIIGITYTHLDHQLLTHAVVSYLRRIDLRSKSFLIALLLQEIYL